MNPLLLGGAAAALLAFIKKSKEQKPKALPQGTGLDKQDTAASDALAVAGATAGTVAAVGGGLATFGTSISGFFGAAAPVVGNFAVALVAACPFLIVVAVIVIANIIFDKLAADKDFVLSMRLLLPSARSLHAFEVGWVEAFATANGIQAYRQGVVSDERFRQTFSIGREKRVYIGERLVYRFDNYGTGKDIVGMQRAMRAAALEYVMYKKKLAYNMLTNWAKLQIPASSQDYWFNHLYDDLPGYEGEKLGGLLQVPLLGDYCEKPRDTDYTINNPRADQLRAVNSSPDWDNKDIPKFLSNARLQAFRECLTVIQKDSTVYPVWKPLEYAKDVYRYMGLSEPEFILQGNILVMPFQAWGFVGSNGEDVHLNVDIIEVKEQGMLANWFTTKA